MFVSVISVQNMYKSMQVFLTAAGKMWANKLTNYMD